jgi:hypothetical protein
VLGQVVRKVRYDFGPTSLWTFVKSVIPDHPPTDGIENIELEALSLKDFMVFPPILLTYLFPLNSSTEILAVRSKFFSDFILLFDQAKNELADKERILKAMAAVNLMISWMKHSHLYLLSNIVASSPRLNMSMEFIIDMLPGHLQEWI